MATDADAAEPSLAPRSLAALRAQYRADLFDDCLPFLDQHVLDHRHGGFMCRTDRSGEKWTVSEGRGLWVYSFLYNEFGGDPVHLEIARRSAGFLLRHRPGDETLWPGSLTREGVPTDTRPHDLYGGLFVADGLVEYAKAAGDMYWHLAKRLLLSHVAVYDGHDYTYRSNAWPDLPPFVGMRVLGHWMVLLRLATQMLQASPDAEVEVVADRAVEAIMDRHLDPDLGLMREILRHDFTPPTNGMESFCDLGHAIEAAWMVMFEAARRQDEALLARAADVFRRHVERAWDDDRGGLRRSVRTDRGTWSPDEFLWVQEEALIGTLFLVERTGDAWARHWFDRIYSYVRQSPLRASWMGAGDRAGTVREGNARVDNFHHPRHLMLNLLALDRLIDREDGARQSATGRVP